MRLEVITTGLLKDQVFWDVMPCRPVNNSILKNYNATVLGLLYPEYEGAIIHQNVGNY